MIYTSYMGNLKNIPTDKISIMRNTPKWSKEYIDTTDINLAPSKELLYSYQNKDIEFEEFESKYLEEISDINIDKIVKKYTNKTLLCTCAPGNRCHRHILTRYLLNNGVDITELPVKDKLSGITVKPYEGKPLKVNEHLLSTSLDGVYRSNKRITVIDYNYYKKINKKDLISDSSKQLLTVKAMMWEGITMYVDIKDLPTNLNALGNHAPLAAIKMSNFITNDILKYIKH